MSYSKNTIKQFWDDETGTRIEIGPDTDGIELIEIRSYHSDGALVERIAMPVEEAEFILEMLPEVIAEIKKPSGNKS